MSRRGARMWRPISLLGGATIVGQLVSFAALPAITRLYGPAVYGGYQAIYATVTILGAVASLRMERAIPLARTELHAKAAVIAALATSSVIAVVCAIVVALAPGSVARALGNESIASSVWVIPIGAWLTSSYVIAMQLAVRQRRHLPIAVRNAAQPAVTAATQVVGGLISAVPTSLNLGLVLGRMVGATTAARQVVKPPIIRPIRLVPSTFRRYRGFALLSAPAGLLNAAALQIPILLIGAYFGATSAGYYGVSSMLAVAPVTIMAGSMSQVVMGDITQRLRERRAGVFSAVGRMVMIASGMALLATIVLLIISRYAGDILGEEWSESGAYMLALCFVMLARLPSSSVAPVLSAFERHRLQLLVDGLRVAWIVGALSGGAHIGWGPEMSILVMALGVAGTYGLSIFLTLAVCRSHDLQMANFGRSL